MAVIGSDTFFKEVVKRFIPNLPNNITKMVIQMKVGDIVRIEIGMFPDEFYPLKETITQYNLTEICRKIESPHKDIDQTPFYSSLIKIQRSLEETREMVKYLEGLSNENNDSF